MSEELKPCPCCGSEKVRVKSKVGSSKANGAYFRGQIICGENQCQLQTKVWKSPERLFAAWNTRKEQPHD